jgi:hypothetical protein
VRRHELDRALAGRRLADDLESVFREEVAQAVPKELMVVDKRDARGYLRTPSQWEVRR